MGAAQRSLRHAELIVAGIASWASRSSGWPPCTRPCILARISG